MALSLLFFQTGRGTILSGFNKAVTHEAFLIFISTLGKEDRKEEK